MTNEEKILKMLVAMQGDIRQINTRLDSMDGRMDSMDGRMDSMDSRLGSLETEVKAVRSDIDDMKESQEEVRTGLNAVLEWTETVSAVVPDIPKIS